VRNIEPELPSLCRHLPLPPDVPTEEAPHQAGYRVAVLLKSEMPRVEKVKLQIPQVPLVRLGAGCRKDRIVLSPDDESRWLLLAEVGLPLRVEGGVAAVAVEKGELDFRIPRTVEQRLVDVPVVRADRLLVPDTGSVLPDGSLAGEKGAQGRLVLRRPFPPVILERLPEVVGDPLVVGVPSPYCCKSIACPRSAGRLSSSPLKNWKPRRAV
jgi:hypothetical protein